MSVSVQKRAAANLTSIATRIPGVRVTMGLACRCGNWCPSINDPTGNRNTGLAEDGLLAVVLRGGADGLPSAEADDLADAQLGYLAACGYRIVGDSAGEQDFNGGRNG